jgi:hypothetical protein
MLKMKTDDEGNAKELPNEKPNPPVLEFFMEYGWAILVVIACVGALFYFGVLGPEPQKVIVHYDCGDGVEYLGTTTSGSLVLQDPATKNSVGVWTEMNMTEITINEDMCNLTDEIPIEEEVE